MKKEQNDSLKLIGALIIRIMQAETDEVGLLITHIILFSHGLCPLHVHSLKAGIVPLVPSLC